MVDHRHADLVGHHLRDPRLHRRCFHVDHRHVAPLRADMGAPIAALRCGRLEGDVAPRCRPRCVHLPDRDQACPRRNIGTRGQLRGDLAVQPHLSINLAVERLGPLLALVVDISRHPALALTVPGTGYLLLVSVFVANALSPAILDSGPTIALHPRAPPTPSLPPATAPACLAHGWNQGTIHSWGTTGNR